MRPAIRTLLALPLVVVGTAWLKSFWLGAEQYTVYYSNGASAVQFDVLMARSTFGGVVDVRRFTPTWSIPMNRRLGASSSYWSDDRCASPRALQWLCDDSTGIQPTVQQCDLGFAIEHGSAGLDGGAGGKVRVAGLQVPSWFGIGALLLLAVPVRPWIRRRIRGGMPEKPDAGSPNPTPAPGGASTDAPAAPS
jgi:hypothetical protein